MIKFTKAQMVAKLKAEGCTVKDSILFKKKYKELKEMLGIPDEPLIKYRKATKEKSPKIKAEKKKANKLNNKVYNTIRNNIKNGYEGPYQAIFELKEMLERAHIPFKMDKVFNGFQIAIKYKYKSKVTAKKYEFQLRNIWVDAIEHDISAGHEHDLLEIQGALTKEEYKLHCNEADTMRNCIGNLTPYEVLHRWKYCIKNQTKYYVKEKE